MAAAGQRNQPDTPSLEAANPQEAGVCLWFTGLSGSGKTTTAHRVGELLEQRGWQVTQLDGDVVRQTISNDLGFSRADRDENVRRVGQLAAQIVGRGGAALCALVSPYRSTRDEVRRIVGAAFVEVFVDTPLEVCAQRDTKGLYAGSQRGEVAALTGVADPYEPPLAPDIHLETVGRSVEQNAQAVLDYLDRAGFSPPR